MKITKKQRKAIGVYIRHCADELGLRDWVFDVVYLPTESDMRNVDDHDGGDQVWGAACDPVRGRKFARILLGMEVLAALIEDGKRDEFRQTVAHELFHCHLTPLWEQIRFDLYESRVLPQAAYDLFIKSVERNLEYANDAMADAASKGLPLIDWSKTSWDDMG